MTEVSEGDYTAFALPSSVVSRVDVSRLVDDAERVDNSLTTDTVRTKAGGETGTVAAPSEQLAAFLDMNQLAFDSSQQRTAIIKQLRLLKDNVPVIHMTFAVEADRESLGQLVSWLREQVHKQTVIAVGLQPGLVAGVYLRTPNHVHDLSLKAKLEGSRDLLVKELEAARG
jgi:hypothetical protein